MLASDEIERVFRILRLDEKLEEITLPDLSVFYLKEEGKNAWFKADNVTTVEAERGL